MDDTRIERDSMGEMAVPADALYGAQTQRAVLNFPIGREPMPAGFLAALLRVKQAAARANVELGALDPARAGAIDAAVEDLLGRPDWPRHFPVDVYQTGSGTSSNMNANEVLATLASRRLAAAPDAADTPAVNANDHVNASQSSNDAVPTALHLGAALALAAELLPALDHLAATLRRKAETDGHHVKTGRTHLMDAMPVRLGQVLGGWAAQVEAGAAALRAQQPRIQAVAQGGTAVGTGVNTPPGFAAAFCRHLGAITGLAITPAPDHFAAMGSQDAAVALSGALRGVAVSLTKIANDLRWMNSGPLAGLAEIELEALQPGSSIMPGKVNPVVPEAVAMACAQVLGHDAAIAIAGQSGNFELNVMLPLVARNLLESCGLLARSARLLADRAIAGFRVNEAGLQAALARNPILVTALNPLIGYAAAAEIAKQAYREGRPVLDVAVERSGLPRDRLAALLDPRTLTGS
ncbi:class II fumarate hydratase [Piscinibacter sakaiensis]|uniref:Fumarate hydratase class II n=2 Tax=Piscinibacter sakaiensis TaxID=1547922 RepID=A0A0K8NZK0_PISS1|nr:class II fumarate hydratase [Piscinibacter sakaiensis]GAP35709.1 fumarate hydratase, class II [Piscinibacter sakaiensis]